MITSVRTLWIELTLRAGAVVLVGYAVAGSLVGVEVFALLAVWPLGIALALVSLVAGDRVRRVRRRSAAD